MTEKIQVNVEEYEKFMEYQNQTKGNPFVGLAKSKTNWVLLAVGVALNFASRRYGLEFTTEEVTLITTLAMYIAGIAMRWVTVESLSAKVGLTQTRKDKVKEVVLPILFSNEFVEFFKRMVDERVLEMIKNSKKRIVKKSKSDNIEVNKK